VTRLITLPEDRQIWTPVRETDTHTALTRGLAEYLEDQEIVVLGLPYRFRYVLPHFATVEEQSDFPSAAVYATAPGKYDAANFTPKVSSKERVPDGRFVMTASELELDLRLEIWAQSPEERSALCAMVEDAFLPADPKMLDAVTWRSGLCLELTHYYGARARYLKTGMGYEDSADEARRRHRIAAFSITGTVPEIRLVGLPTFPEQRPVRTSVTVTEATVAVDP
jgi:hypothetical protein